MKNAIYSGILAAILFPLMLMLVVSERAELGALLTDFTTIATCGLVGVATAMAYLIGQYSRQFVDPTLYGLVVRWVGGIIAGVLTIVLALVLDTALGRGFKPPDLEYSFNTILMVGPVAWLAMFIVDMVLGKPQILFSKK